jgi:hypothetical protein
LPKLAYKNAILYGSCPAVKARPAFGLGDAPTW